MAKQRMLVEGGHGGSTLEQSSPANELGQSSRGRGDRKDVSARARRYPEGDTGSTARHLDEALLPKISVTWQCSCEQPLRSGPRWKCSLLLCLRDHKRVMTVSVHLHRPCSIHQEQTMQGYSAQIWTRTGFLTSSSRQEPAHHRFNCYLLCNLWYSKFECELVKAA